MNNWLYRGMSIEEPPEGAAGFVYRITNLDDGRKYVGRKYLETVKRTKVEGKTRRKVVRKESNWRSYCGSCKPLLEQIKKLGRDFFRFEILAFGYTRGQVNFLEENIQHRLNVLTDDTYYNDSIGARGFIGVKIDAQFKEIISGIAL
jgi:hypothetical protein